MGSRKVETQLKNQFAAFQLLEQEEEEALNQEDPAIQQLDKAFAKTVDRTADVASRFRKEICEVLMVYPLSDRIEKRVFQNHRKIQHRAVNLFEEPGGMYTFPFSQLNFTPTRRPKGSKGFKQKSKEEAIKTGREGEKYAEKYLNENYGSYANVEWMNKIKESGLSFDFKLTCKVLQKVVFVEVKTTTLLHKEWFHISDNEYMLAKEQENNYWILHVFIDEKEIEEKKRYRVNHFRNPINNPGLNLVMKYCLTNDGKGKTTTTEAGYNNVLTRGYLN